MEMEEAGLVLGRLDVPEPSVSTSLHDLDDLEVALEEVRFVVHNLTMLDGLVVKLQPTETERRAVVISYV
jgi:hypothetical protein